MLTFTPSPRSRHRLTARTDTGHRVVVMRTKNAARMYVWQAWVEAPDGRRVRVAQEHTHAAARQAALDSWRAGVAKLASE